MKKKIIIALALFAIYTGYLFVTTFQNTGQKAIAAMTVEERAYLQTVMKVKKGMTLQDTIKILGEPSRSQPDSRPTWRVNGSPFSQIAIYFYDGKVFKVRWMRVGSFIYEQ